MTINSKSSKAEILAAYKDLEKQKKSLEAEIRQQDKSGLAANAPAVSQSKPEIETGQNTNPDLAPDLAKTIQSLEKIQGSFGGAVSNLSEQLIAEATELEAVKIAIAAETQDLENLHQLTDIDESTIDFLLDQYQASSKKFTAEYEQQQGADRQAIEALEQRWAKEQQAHDKLVATRNEDYGKNRQREQAEYQYNLELGRNLDESEHRQQQKLKQQELAEVFQQIEQQWQQQEAEIAQQEQEYATAAAKIIAFESELQDKIKQGTEEGKGIGAYQSKVKTDLRERELEGEKQNYQLRIESLEHTIKHQASRVEKLSQQLDSSLQQVQNLAVKAIEGTSNRNSFEAVKAIAMEQAKTPQKGK
ncbi:MAG: hypothetical protein HC930_02750 [Hydrococcus sp. SU_1_0]|nr:hypothetical protein [Hydrococcus sp. SU_1_0]